ncbi:MAG: insulinase family protein [Candidatus Shikimatogenerans sp. AspAUS03]|uniref:Insulinase family protein n=1 Tax=Candidatus Shikimatogenerans sp. AspAUS03 TaxID=3158563 RepID=A0AAU7QSB2_9FLAO
MINFFNNKIKRYKLSNNLHFFFIKKNNNNIIQIEIKCQNLFIKNKYLLIFKLLFNEIILMGSKNFNIKNINKFIQKYILYYSFTLESIKIEFLKKNIKKVMFFFSDLIINHKFNNYKYFNKILKKFLIYYNIYINNPNYIFYDLNNILYKNIFKIKFLYKITLKDIKKIYNIYFKPNNLNFFILGNLRNQYIKLIIKKYFFLWNNKYKHNLLINNSIKYIYYIPYILNKKIIYIKFISIINKFNLKIIINLLILNYIINNIYVFKRFNKYIKNIFNNITINKLYLINIINIQLKLKNKYINKCNYKIYLYKYLIKIINKKTFQNIKKIFINNIIFDCNNCYKLFNNIYYIYTKYNILDLTKLIINLSFKKFYLFIYEIFYNNKYIDIFIGDKIYFKFIKYYLLNLKIKIKLLN